jgi:hypothetical protein
MHWALWIPVGLAAWILAGIAAAPFVGAWLSRKAEEQSRPLDERDQC